MKKKCHLDVVPGFNKLVVELDLVSDVFHFKMLLLIFKLKDIENEDEEDDDEDRDNDEDYHIPKKNEGKDKARGNTPEVNNENKDEDNGMNIDDVADDGEFLYCIEFPIFTSDTDIDMEDEEERDSIPEITPSGTSH